MKIRVQTKLFLGFMAVALGTMVLVSLGAHYFISREFRDLLGGENPPQFPWPGGEGGGRPPEDLFLRDIKIYFTLAAMVGGILAGLISFWFAKFWVNPIKKVIETTQKIARGQYKDRIETHSKDEIGDLCRSVNAMASELEAMEKLRKELMSNVAHELATPLTNISGYLEALHDGTIQGEAPTRKTIKLLKEETDRLAFMVKDVRALSVTENPTLCMIFKSYDAKSLIEGVVMKMKPEYEKKDITLSICVEGTPQLEVDKDKFSQILINLLSNAILHTPSKGKITLAVRAKKEGIEMAVQDNGEGISQQDLPHIFERFYRADKSRSRETGGLGVGLTIARALVEAHGGTIEAESKVGQGSRFTCIFPLRCGGLDLH
jgi:signal transduction histidine kinase